jgi:hypothetical protein
MVVTVAPRGPVTSSEHERPTLADAEELLRERRGAIFLVDEQGNRIEMPETVVRLVHQIVQSLAQGNPVEVTALPKEFSIQRAAAFLDLRPEDVVRLIDQGELPVVESQGNRRIRFEDVLAYKPTRDADRRAALTELTRLSQEMGLYDLEDERIRRNRSQRGEET